MRGRSGYREHYARKVGNIGGGFSRFYIKHKKQRDTGECQQKLFGYDIVIVKHTVPPFRCRFSDGIELKSLFMFICAFLNL